MIAAALASVLALGGPGPAHAAQSEPDTQVLARAADGARLVFHFPDGLFDATDLEGLGRVDLRIARGKRGDGQQRRRPADPVLPATGHRQRSPHVAVVPEVELAAGATRELRFPARPERPGMSPVPAE